MSYTCPLCNGLIESNILCPHCSLRTLDYGRLDDYADPYEPYIIQASGDSTSSSSEASSCVHLLYCENCRQAYQCLIHEWDTE